MYIHTYTCLYVCTSFIFKTIKSNLRDGLPAIRICTSAYRYVCKVHTYLPVTLINLHYLVVLSFVFCI